jgi:hypothetical protein
MTARQNADTCAVGQARSVKDVWETAFLGFSALLSEYGAGFTDAGTSAVG